MDFTPLLSIPYALPTHTRRRRRPTSAKGKRAPAPIAPSPPPPPGSSSVDFAKWLGHHGMILVLFETPSGFALLSYDGVNLLLPKALENIWSDFINKYTLEDTVVFPGEFQIFEDKASAINSNGLSYKLAKMIKSSLLRGQKLAVGKREYKDIIEANLGIHCLFDEAVLELMWGLKNVIKVLVPDEKLELTNEDRLQISRGMQSVLDRYGFNDVEASLVNSDIIDLAYCLYECDVFEDGRSALLERGREQIQKVSGIDSKKWTKLKLATALKLICYPEDKIVIGDSEDILSKTEAEKLVADAHLYKHKLDSRTCSVLYKDIVSAQGLRDRTLALLGTMVKKAKEDLKLHHRSFVKEEEDQALDLLDSTVKEAGEDFKEGDQALNLLGSIKEIEESSAEQNMELRHKSSVKRLHVLKGCEEFVIGQTASLEGSIKELEESFARLVLLAKRGFQERIPRLEHLVKTKKTVEEDQDLNLHPRTLSMGPKEELKVKLGCQMQME